MLVCSYLFLRGDSGGGGTNGVSSMAIRGANEVSGASEATQIKLKISKFQAATRRDIQSATSSSRRWHFPHVRLFKLRLT